MCNTYCFSTTTTVSHRSLIVTFRQYTHCLSCLFLSEFVLYLLTGLSKYLGTKHAFHIDNALWCLGRFYRSQLIKNIQTDISYLFLFIELKQNTLVRIYMYVYIYMCIYVYTCICLYMYMHVHIHIYTCIYIYEYIYVYLCIYMYIYVHTHHVRLYIFDIEFYVLLTVHPGMTMGEWPTWCTITLYNTYLLHGAESFLRS